MGGGIGKNFYTQLESYSSFPFKIAEKQTQKQKQKKWKKTERQIEDIRKLRRFRKDRNENVSAQDLGKTHPSFSLVV